MAQANVAREPSMEEILASIRKIIESNEDTAEDTPHAVTSGRPATASGASIFGGREAEPPLSVVNAAPAFRSSALSDAARAMPPTTNAPKASPAPAASTATAAPSTVQPSTNQAVTRNFLAADDKKSESTGTDLSKADKSPLLANSASSRPAVSPQVPAAPAVAIARPDAEGATPYKSRQADELAGSDKFSVTRSAVATGSPAPDIAKTDSVTAVRKDPMPINTSAQVATRREDTPTTDEGRALISPEAGAKVAASFGNLNHAVSNGPTRSFDEIAEEMLQPMLQQWLDDNLPTMVERLVREEIERVARGR